MKIFAVFLENSLLGNDKILYYHNIQHVMSAKQTNKYIFIVCSFVRYFKTQTKQSFFCSLVCSSFVHS